MRLSRGCYDKFHRCPGWAGGGFTGAKTERCDGGYIFYKWDNRHTWKWRPWHCDTCNVVVWPWMTRWLDPSWWRWWFPFKLRDRRYRR